MADTKEKMEKKKTTKEHESLKEKYDSVLSKFYYYSLLLAAIGIFYLGKSIGEFRNRVIPLNPEYKFSNFSDFKICIILTPLISMFKYFFQKFITKFCEKINNISTKSICLSFMNIIQIKSQTKYDKQNR